MVRYEVHTPPDDVGLFVKPLGVDRGVETLFVAPYDLFVFLGVFEAHSNDVVFTKELLDGSHYDGL